MGWTTRIAALIAALSLLGAACSQSGDTTDTAAGTTEAGAEAEPDANDSAGDATDDAAASEPVTDDTTDSAASDDESSEDDPVPSDMSVADITEILFPSFEQDDQAALEAQWEDEERERQILIAECMAAEGFEYQPVEYPGGGISFGPGADLDPTSREYAEAYGFGWSTTFAEEEAFADDTASDWVDPNQEYVEGLSDGARDAYYLALYGNQPEIDETMSEDEINAMLEENPELFGPSGCEGEAWEQSSQFGEAEKVWREFGDQLNDLYERVQADPRVVAVQDAWAECMAGKGHAFAAMEDMYQQLSERMDELWGADTYEDPLADFTEEEIAALTDEDFEALFSGPQVDEELLAEIQEWEISLALDSWDCGGTKQFEDFEEIFAEYQTTFIEENLDAIRAALAAS